MPYIEGIPVTPAEYQRLHFVITNEKQAGAKFTERDIRELIQSGRHPNKDIKKTVDKLDEKMKKDE